MKLKSGQLLILNKEGYYATYVCEEPNDLIRVFLEKRLDRKEGSLSGMYLICQVKDISIIN